MDSLANLAIAQRSSLLQARVMLIQDVRRKNLLLLQSRHRATQAELARAIGTSPNTANQILTEHRNMGQKVARRAEERLKLPRGWMDEPHPRDWEMITLPTYDERPTRPRALSHEVLTIASRLDALGDDRLLAGISRLLDAYETRDGERLLPQIPDTPK